MSLLQNIANTIYSELQSLECSVQHGFPATVPTVLTVALEHDKTKVDEQHELAGYRKRPRVFFADVYATTKAERNDVCEAIKDMFENKVLQVQNEATGVMMVGDGVRVEVDLTQSFKARAKIYVYTLVN